MALATRASFSPKGADAAHNVVGVSPVLFLLDGIYDLAVHQHVEYAGSGKVHFWLHAERVTQSAFQAARLKDQVESSKATVNLDLHRNLLLDFKNSITFGIPTAMLSHTPAAARLSWAPGLPHLRRKRAACT